MDLSTFLAWLAAFWRGFRALTNPTGRNLAMAGSAGLALWAAYL